MNTVLNMQRLIQEAANMTITRREDIRTALLLRFRSLTAAAIALGVDNINLSHVLHGRHATLGIVRALQQELELTDEQVLEFWPLLKRWPREGK